MQWSVRPFVRIILFYIPGIILGNNIGDADISTFSVLLIFSFLIIIGFSIAKWFTSYKNRWFVGVSFYSMVFLFGIFNSYNTAKELSKIAVDDKAAYYVGEIINDPIQTNKSVRLELEIVRNGQNKDSISNFRILAYLEKTIESTNLVYGDKIVFETKLNKSKNPGNPGEFNYAGFLAFKGIVYTTYLNKKQWSFLTYDSSNKLIAFAKGLRQALLLNLKEHSYLENTFEVSAAILLGYDILMDAETEQAFMNAGAMHILCVSGLHVGIVFMMISLVLNFLKATRFGVFIRIILLLLTVWSYALLTGMSPSIQRASVMISFFIIGEGLSRLKDNYNTLAASAFVMLLVNPNLVYSVGFQLSYAAVIGIISIYRPVYNLLYIKNKPLDYIWSITAVSFAATIGTFPIATHYFHYFPTYFWLVNLFIIPLSFLVIMVGFVFIIVSWIPYLSALMGGATSALVYLLNHIVGLVKWFPYYGFDDIYMPLIKVVLVYLVIVVSFQIFFFNKIRLLKYLIFLALLLFLFNTQLKYNRLKHKEITIYNVKKHDVLEFVDGKTSLLISDSTFLYDEKLQSFTLEANQIRNGISTIFQLELGRFNDLESDNIFMNGNFLAFYNKKYFLLTTSDSLFQTANDKKLNVDAVIISGKKSFDMDKLQQCIVFSKIIISSSVPYWKQKLILKKCNEAGIECFNVNAEGLQIWLSDRNAITRNTL